MNDMAYFEFIAGKGCAKEIIFLVGSFNDRFFIKINILSVRVVLAAKLIY